jgi:hypothetical protein
MIRVKVSNGILIKENALSLRKRHPVLAFVFPALCLIPFETYATHMHIVHIFEEKSSGFWGANGFCKGGFKLKVKLGIGFDDI